MSDRIEATLGQMFRDHFFNSPHEDTRCCVEEFLEALKANRIALVELPEANSENPNEWIDLTYGDERVELVDDEIGLTAFARYYSVGEAQAIAAALLAAAAEVTE
ncbi:DNA methyltransferase [Mycobacterium phage Firehouse51]|uniref:Uncharacterized protein n=2 Tax=Cheoctovirus TaxID=1623281 RepID=A0A7M1CKP3_9CAUD|nr:DNA methyltransferase [Mycobacterium phage Mutaforma13]YP_009957158.1 DNA methyltransferase [Mycobacterium phage Firehouse51]AEJ93144.1 hypothetical protein MUTAFORMA13_67 [Mycobacterium phage Mutaforma13]QOP65025.1 hypothetical protein SEA_FIREHOUSE51_64 [Mycobacterium phage Firehouse51]